MEADRIGVLCAAALFVLAGGMSADLARATGKLLGPDEIETLSGSDLGLRASADMAGRPLRAVGAYRGVRFYNPRSADPTAEVVIGNTLVSCADRVRRSNFLVDLFAAAEPELNALVEMRGVVKSYRAGRLTLLPGCAATFVADPIAVGSAAPRRYGARDLERLLAEPGYRYSGFPFEAVGEVLGFERRRAPPIGGAMVAVIAVEKARVTCFVNSKKSDTLGVGETVTVRGEIYRAITRAEDAPRGGEKRRRKAKKPRLTVRRELALYAPRCAIASD